MKNIYLFLLFLSPISLFHAQQLVTGPGGVPGAVLWMQTVPLAKDLNGSYRWQDYSGDSLRLTYLTSKGEYQVFRQYFGHGYNFHPSLRLTNPSESKEVRIVSDNLSTSTIIGVFGEHNLGGDKFAQADYILTLNSSAGKGFVVDKNKITNSTESSRGQLDYGSAEGYDLMYHAGQSPEPTLDAFKVRTLRSFTYIRTNKPVTGVWGERRQSNLSLGEKFYTTNPNNNSAYDTSKFNASSIFDSYIPEMIIYGRMLSPLERIKAETYLAIKYGFMLDRSYISSSDLLLWDISRNITYNNRITGLYRDDKSGLYQRQSSTSYEESPNYSYLALGDSYDNADTYNLSNRNKLLVVERFPANTMQDGDYTLWGDNGNTITTTKSDEYLGMKLMNRKWLVETNMGGRTANPQQMQWTASSNLQLTHNGYKLTLKKAANATVNATLASSVPLAGYEGHISFTLTSPLGGALVKFGTQNTPETANSNDYGIYINEKGEVYPIIHGVPQWSSKWSLLVKAGDRIRINKTRDYLIISRNGDATKQTGQAYPQLSIQDADKDKPFYVSVGLYKDWSNEVTLQDFRVGGFIDTGNRLELSYIASRAAEFANYKDAQAYLLVDHSGTGNFKKEDTELYLSDEYDSYRSKIVFNNVFFDPDNSGKDIFTFGYRETNLVAQATKTDPTCSTSGESLSNGKIHIDILRGDEAFEYQLIEKTGGTTVRSGAFFGKAFDISSISQGDYTLKLKEVGGMNTVPTNPSSGYQANSQYALTASTQGSQLETTLKKPQSQVYQMGLSSGTAAGSALKHGFEVNQGKIYIIENSIKSATPLSGVQMNIGDKIQVTNNPRGKIQYQVNGTPFYTRNADATYYYVMKSATPDSLYNVKPTGMGSYGWNNQNITLNLLSESQVEQSLTLESGCKQPQTQLKEAESSNLMVYYPNSFDQSRVTARLQLSEPSPVSMIVFNLSGVMVYRQELTESKKEHTVDITGLPQGVYIVKFLTQEGEFTKKITLNY